MPARSDAVQCTGLTEVAGDFLVQRFPSPGEHQGGNAGNDVQGRVRALPELRTVGGRCGQVGGEGKARRFHEGQ